MNSYFNGLPRKKTKVTILATYPLVRQSLRLLVDGDRELSVLDAVGTTGELIEKASRRNPDVVVLCLMENEGKNIEALADLRRVSSHTKVVILAAPNCSVDHSAAIKSGVTGIVGMNQHSRVLIRAVQQVADGEVWLNQKLLAQLLENNFDEAANVRKGKTKNFCKQDELTSREMDIVATIGLGLNNRQISKKLFISEATVRHHLSSIYGKLQIEDRLNLAIYAHRHRIVSPSPTIAQRHPAALAAAPFAANLV